MTRIWIPGSPGSTSDDTASEIRATCVAAALPLPVAARVIWLLAHGASLVFEGSWPASLTALESRIYHRRSANAVSLFVIALIEHGEKGGGGYMTITPAGGAAATKTLTDDAASTAWGDPGWQSWVVALPLVDSGLQYHAIEWDGMAVRYLSVFELVRDELDTASDVMVAMSSGSYAGLEAGRWITDGSAGSVRDLLLAVNSAKDATKRHGGGVIFADGTPWTITSGSRGNVADGTLGTSGFYWPWRARRLKVGTETVAHEVRIRAKTSSGTGRFYLQGLWDTVAFTSISSSWAWHSPDDSATLDVGAGSDDTLWPEGYCLTGGATLSIASVQWFE